MSSLRTNAELLQLPASDNLQLVGGAHAGKNYHIYTALYGSGTGEEAAAAGGSYSPTEGLGETLLAGGEQLAPILRPKLLQGQIERPPEAWVGQVQRTADAFNRTPPALEGGTK